jgi:hypothetical protein
MTALHLTDRDMTPPFFCQHFILPTFLLPTFSLLELVGAPALERAPAGVTRVDPAQKIDKLGRRAARPARARAASGGKLIWISAVVNSSQANRGRCGTPIEQPQHPLQTRAVEVMQRYHVAL